MYCMYRCSAREATHDSAPIMDRLRHDPTTLSRCPRRARQHACTMSVVLECAECFEKNNDANAKTWVPSSIHERALIGNE